MTNEIIIKKLQNKNLIKKLKDNRIKHLWLFGSFAKWIADEDSDIDLLYEYDSNLPNNWWNFGLFGCLGFLEESFQKKIDFISVDSIHPDIKNEILSSKIQIW